MPELQSRLQAALAGRYRLEGEIGEGGMATVYLAHDLRHDRRVALKVLRPELAAVIGAERFLAEIKLTANLQHPHILPLFDSGETDGFLYYVMPFIEGESLRDRLRREKQLPIDEAVRLTREVASALDYAHRHGVIHRDIKPENILLHDGQALVADFGIALAASRAGSRMTETGMSLGTPHYMSPEQAMGEREITARSDVYALGCVLYEMLTGEPPFTGPTAQAVVAKVITEKPADLIPRRETVPSHVEAAVLTALAKLPADRFATVAEFSAALDERTGGRVDRRTVVRASAHPARVWWAALGGAAVTAVVVGLLWLLTGRSPGASAGAGERAQHTFTGRAGMPALSPDGTFLAYVERTCGHGEDLCRYALLVQEVGTNRPVLVLQDVARIGDVRWTRDGSSLVLAGDLGGAGVGLFVLPRLGGTPRRVADEGSFDTNPAADSAIILVPDATPTTVRVVALTTGGVGDSVVLPHVRQATGVAWSPSGDRVALASTSTLWLVDRREGAVLDSAGINTRGTLRWTVRGDALLTFMPQRGREDHLLRVAARRHFGPVSIALARIPTLYQGQFDVARRTGRLAVATGDPIQDLWGFQIVSARATGRQLTRGTTWYGGPVLSADGVFAYYLRGDAVGDNLYRLRLSDGFEEALTAEHQAGVDIASLTPDGSAIIYGDRPDGGGTELTRFELASRRLSRQATRAAATAWMLPGGRMILQSQGIWSTADSFAGVTAARAVPDSLRLLRAAVGPDSARVAALLQSGDSSVLAIVDLATFQVTRLAELEAVTGTTANAVAWIGRDIYVARWPERDSLPSIWRVPAAGGRLELVAILPAPCSVGYIAVADQGRKAICSMAELRSDIWTVEGIGR